VMFLVNRVYVSDISGVTSLYLGTSKTSSNVIPSVIFFISIGQ
jgi:hypothetical protein